MHGLIHSLEVFVTALAGDLRLLSVTSGLLSIYCHFFLFVLLLFFVAYSQVDAEEDDSVHLRRQVRRCVSMYRCTVALSGATELPTKSSRALLPRQAYSRGLTLKI